MKWVALLVILLIIVIIFGLWRRTQPPARGSGEIDPRPRQSPPLPATPGLPTTGGMPPVFDAAAPPLTVNVDPRERAAEPAAERSADEVGWAPAAEQPATPDPAEPIPSSADDNWWQDEVNPRRDDPAANT